MGAQRSSRSRKRTIAKATALAIILLFVSAGGVICQDVRFNVDKGVDLSKFKTYKWVAMKDVAKVDELTAKDIKAAVNAELSKKGLEIDDSDNADLDVGYQAAVDDEKQVNSYSSGWAESPGWDGGWYTGGWNGWSEFTTTTTSTIYIGQLDLSFYDSRGHDLVWRGVVSQTIDPNAKPTKQQKKLKKAVGKLLKNFPPGNEV
jgi:uncharacterized protein DUF4136